MKKDRIFQFIKNRGLLVIILLALIIRLGFFVSLRPWDKEVVDNKIVVFDAIGYNHLALSFLSNKSFEDFDALRTPGYPVFVALLFFISSGSIWFVLIIQILISLASVFLVFKIAEISFSKKVALLASLFFAIDILQVLYTVSLLTETIFIFLLLAAVFYLIKSIKENKYSTICLSAFFLGVATLVRPISIILPFVVIFFICVFSTLKIGHKLLFSSLYYIVFIVAISPWLLRNYGKYEELSLSSISGSNLLFSNVAYTEVYKTGKNLYQVQNALEDMAIKQGYDKKDLNSFKNSRICSNIAKQYIKDNFSICFKRYIIGISDMYLSLGKQSISPIFQIKSNSNNFDLIGGKSILKTVKEYFGGITLIEILIIVGMFFYLLMNYLFSLYGSFSKLFKQNNLLVDRFSDYLGSKDNYVILFILIILYFSVLTGTVGYSRFRLPFMPFINILCAVGITNFYFQIGNKQSKVQNLN
jgi:4-amino-4-deoxy-L-arabinose transferase-like glycosyltransferase